MFRFPFYTYKKENDRGRKTSMYALLLIVIMGLKTLLCKGAALGIFLLFFWIKGKQLQFNSDRWDDFFISFPAKRANRYAVVIYLTAAVISSAVCYVVLRLAKYRYSLEIAVLLFAGGLIITAYKWHTKGKDYLLKRYQEVSETILEKRECEKQPK